MVESHLLEYTFVFGYQIFVVVNTSQCLLRTQLISEETCRDIIRLGWRDGYEQIHILHTDTLEIVDRCWSTDLGQQVVVRIQIAQSVLAVVNKSDIHILAREEFRQVAAYCSSACNNDSHMPSLSNCNN